MAPAVHNVAPTPAPVQASKKPPSATESRKPEAAFRRELRQRRNEHSERADAAKKPSRAKGARTAAKPRPVPAEEAAAEKTGACKPAPPGAADPDGTVEAPPDAGPVQEESSEPRATAAHDKADAATASLLATPAPAAATDGPAPGDAAGATATEPIGGVPASASLIATAVATDGDDAADAVAESAPEPVGGTPGPATAPKPAAQVQDDSDWEEERADDRASAPRPAEPQSQELPEAEAASSFQTQSISPDDSAPPVPSQAHPGATADPVLLTPDLATKHSGSAAVAHPPPPDVALPAEARFAADNHENIVRDMRAQVLPNGGSVRIRLDPPQLGALQVTVHMQDGVVTAAFETSSDEATRLLGHSLNQLKTVLESHGVTVDKLQVQQVQQSPKNEPQQSPRDGQQERGQNPQDQDHAARQEQQRREMLRRMWRRLAGGGDPLDVTG